jgi:hypothetical protein
MLLFCFVCVRKLAPLRPEGHRTESLCEWVRCVTTAARLRRWRLSNAPLPVASAGRASRSSAPFVRRAARVAVPRQQAFICSATRRFKGQGKASQWGSVAEPAERGRGRRGERDRHAVRTLNVSDGLLLGGHAPLSDNRLGSGFGNNGLGQWLWPSWTWKGQQE